MKPFSPEEVKKRLLFSIRGRIDMLKRMNMYNKKDDIKLHSDQSYVGESSTLIRRIPKQVSRTSMRKNGKRNRKATAWLEQHS